MKSVMVDSFSAPTTSTVRLCPDAISPSATVSAYRYPGQAAPMSNAAALSAPSRAWRSQAVDGSSRSGLAVREHDAVELGGGHSGALQRDLAGLATQHGDGLLRPRDLALSDAGALDDPLVGRVEHPGEVMVGEHPVGYRRADAGDLGEGTGDHACATVGAQGELRPDVLTQAGAGGLERHPHRVLDRVHARRAVADDRYAFHAEQRRAAVGRSSRGSG